jgi:hypothetical protein
MLHIFELLQSRQPFADPNRIVISEIRDTQRRHCFVWHRQFNYYILNKDRAFPFLINFHPLITLRVRTKPSLPYLEVTHYLLLCTDALYVQNLFRVASIFRRFDLVCRWLRLGQVPFSFFYGKGKCAYQLVPPPNLPKHLTWHPGCQGRFFF